ncbi:DUF5986 family protein [Tissierella praeacuta]|uniref:DUF5986 family protein n=1 Tax=Tissierella praeacuta TaxID=43131 RepID=UPI003DA38580
MKKSYLPGETLSRKEVELIVNAINHSKVQYKEWANERNLGFSNGKYLDRWNYIFANIRDSFNYEPFKVFSIKRGTLWEFAVIYNTGTKILYLLLREDNFKRIKEGNDNAYHYIRVLNSKNSQTKIDTRTQISMFPKTEVASDNYINEDLENMLLSIKDEVKGCRNIVFTENKNGVIRISENIANYHLDIIDSFDLTKYITADIENISDTQNENVESHPVIELKIRQDKMKSKKDDIISGEDKKDKKDEEDL